jgi:two-component system response regulator PilR (NtrC family)
MPDPGRVLVVDDEANVRELLTVILGRDGYQVRTAPDGAQALAAFREGKMDLVLQDLKMPGMDGLALLKSLKEVAPTIPVIVLTAFATWDSAVEAMRLGAYDYLKKPFDNDQVRHTVQRAITRLRRFREAGAGATAGRHWVGNSPALREVAELVRRVAPTDSTVLIQGESGTGKELIARAIHDASLRAQETFLTVNCAAFPETLLESELFGHARGAFTGAVSAKKGLLEVADRGTFFLDEIGDMPLSLQSKLLRVLEDRAVLPVGETRPHQVDVRFVTATHRDLEAAVKSGDFRADLYYRLNVVPIHLPPLRERREDIPLLAGHFLAVYAKRLDRPVVRFTDRALEALMNYRWPGNVRELENTIQRSVALGTTDRIDLEDIDVRMRTAVPLPAAVGGPGQAPSVVLPSGGMDLEEVLADIERAYLAQALAKTGGNLTQAAVLLGLSLRSIRYKVSKLNVPVP